MFSLQDTVEVLTTQTAPAPTTLLAYVDLCILRQYAVLSGVEGVLPTLTGVAGTCREGAEVFGVELVVLEDGAVEMVCLDGPDAGERAEVSSLSELREGLAASALAAAVAGVS